MSSDEKKKKVTVIICVDLRCSHCCRKIKNALCVLQRCFDIESIDYEVKENVINVSGYFDGQSFINEILCLARRCIKKIEIKPPPPPKKEPPPPPPCPCPPPPPWCWPPPPSCSWPPPPSCSWPPPPPPPPPPPCSCPPPPPCPCPRPWPCTCPPPPPCTCQPCRPPICPPCSPAVPWDKDCFKVVACEEEPPTLCSIM